MPRVAPACVLAACTSGGAATAAPSASERAAARPLGRSAPSAPAELTPVKLQLQWVPQAQFAGYFAAQDQGYYEEEGLDVTILAGGSTSSARRSSPAAGRVRHQLGAEGCSQPRESGADLVVIAQIFQRSGDPAGVVQGQEHHQAGRLQGQEDRRLGFGNESELFAGAEKAGLDPDNRLRSVIAALRHDRLLQPAISMSPRR